MDLHVTQALRAGQAPSPRRGAGPVVLVAGAAGALGAAVLEQLIAGRGFAQVQVLVTQPLNTGALTRLVTLPWSGHDALALPQAAHTTAVLVFDRERHANGRELAYWRPSPEDLLAFAQRLQTAGVRRLVIVLPHVLSQLPHALRQGLVSLDEQAVAALGFEHLLILRPAKAPTAEAPRHPGERLAQWMLSQLSMMVPQRDRPVQAVKVARFAARLAERLAASPAGTRVVPPEVVWQAAQLRDPAVLADAWLEGRTGGEAEASQAAAAR